MKMKKTILILLVILSTGILFSYELCTLINSPTAGILQKGEASIIANLYKNNGLIIGTKVGLFPRFMFGVSYGGEQIVGNKNPVLHDRVEFNAKFRIIDEAVTYPAVAFGYDSQGHGEHQKIRHQIERILSRCKQEFPNFGKSRFASWHQSFVGKQR